MHDAPRHGRRLAVFDLDGTIVDSLPDLAAALDRLMAASGRPGFDHATVAAMIGDGAQVLVERACAARGLAFGPALVEAFLAEYGPRAAEATRPFPGIVAALDRLDAAGWRLAVCTNKPEAPARALLAELGLAARFVAVVGGDSVPARKPDPGHLLACVAAGGGDAARAVMVGDHRNDVAAARAAGIACVFASWGYGAGAMAEGAAAVAGAPAALPDLLARLVPG
jgi:phosphoglycolate phosphatase